MSNEIKTIIPMTTTEMIGALALGIVAAHKLSNSGATWRDAESWEASTIMPPRFFADMDSAARGLNIAREVLQSCDSDSDQTQSLGGQTAPEHRQGLTFNQLAAIKAVEALESREPNDGSGVDMRIGADGVIRWELETREQAEHRQVLQSPQRLLVERMSRYLANNRFGDFEDAVAYAERLVKLQQAGFFEPEQHKEFIVFREWATSAVAEIVGKGSLWAEDKLNGTPPRLGESREEYVARVTGIPF